VDTQHIATLTAEPRISLATVRRLAARLGVCVGITVDPRADLEERWVACIGLDAIGAGSTAAEALGVALAGHRG